MAVDGYTIDSFGTIKSCSDIAKSKDSIKSLKVHLELDDSL